MTRLPEPTADLTGDCAAAATPQALVDRRELAFIAVERTRMPMVITDPRQSDNPIVLANKAFLHQTGYAASEVLGRNCRFLQGPDSDPAALDEIRAAIAEGRALVTELLNYRKDGSCFWNQLCLSPIHDDKGQLIYYFGSQMDITRRRKAQELEAAEHMLLREVDHRAMNALALVQGIVRLTRADGVANYAAAVQGRVGALARAHVILADRSWRQAPLSQLLHEEIRAHGDYPFALDGPELSVSAQLVQPLVLVFHELVANTAAHGAWSVPTGAVAIHWREDDKSQTVRLHWRETGGPAPPADRKPGFGSTMIKAIIERQLRGKLRMAWDADGLNAHMSFPIELPSVGASNGKAPGETAPSERSPMQPHRA